MARDGRERETERIRDLLVRVTEGGECDDALLLCGERAWIAGVGCVAASDDEAAAIGVEAVDETPASVDEALPEIDRGTRIVAHGRGACAIDATNRRAERLARVRALRCTVRMLAPTVGREDGRVFITGERGRARCASIAEGSAKAQTR